MQKVIKSCFTNLLRLSLRSETENSSMGQLKTHTNKTFSSSTGKFKSKHNSTEQLELLNNDKEITL